jgi:hypothetical protein
MVRGPGVTDVRAPEDPGTGPDAVDGTADDAPRGRDFYDELERWLGIAILVACCVYVFVELQPALLLRNTTITGGDTGAHVWFPDFLIDHFLPWKVAGWSNDFYAGFPAGQFYFPFPAVLIALLDVVVPYNIAFKLVTALGPVLLPVGAYVFAKGVRAPRPSAPVFALFAVGFLYLKDGGETTRTFDLHIMGGTLASTLAGEFSFMIALGLALCFLGTLVRALDRRGALWVPAVLLALTVTSHLVVGVFAVFAGGVVWLIVHPVRNFTRTAAISGVGVLLTAFWLLPLAVNLGNTTDMRYEPLPGTGQSYWDWMFLGAIWFLYPLALVAIGAGIWYRRRATLIVASITVVSGLAFYEWEGVRAVLGKAPAWNLRLLPFWYVMVYLLAALGVAELLRLLALGVTWLIRGSEERSAPEPARVAPVEPAEPAAIKWSADDETTGTLVGSVPEPVSASQPAGPPWRAAVPRRGVRVLVASALAVVLTVGGLLLINNAHDFLPYWAKYNYTGYESGSADNFTAKSWPEYRAFMDTANNLAPGRMAWEPGDAIGAYGTPLALMLLPYWTHGRIQSMEGLYFEASTTTPYHFMTIATLAQTPSNPVRGLPYKTIADFDLGVRYLQLMGVRYYAAFTDAAKAKAAANPSLTPVATVPDLDGKPPSGWTIYQVADSPTVQALTYRPVVIDGLHGGQSWACEGQPKPTVATPDMEFSPWDCASIPWFSDPGALDRPLTDGGPADWQHATQEKARSLPKESLPKVDVTNVRTTESSVAFDVSRTGVPVMVKTSSYPNWKAEGAKGPWRATPNFMVVVPTSKHVKLTFTTATVDWVGRVLTVVGVLGLGALIWWGVVTRRRGDPDDSDQPDDSDGSDDDGPDDGGPDDGAERGADPAAGGESSRADGFRRRIRFASRVSR